MTCTSDAPRAQPAGVSWSSPGSHSDLRPRLHPHHQQEVDWVEPPQLARWVDHLWGGKGEESVLFLKKTQTHTKSEDITEKLTEKTLPDVKEEVMSHDDPEHSQQVPGPELESTDRQYLPNMWHSEVGLHPRRVFTVYSVFVKVDNIKGTMYFRMPHAGNQLSWWLKWTETQTDSQPAFKTRACRQHRTHAGLLEVPVLAAGAAGQFVCDAAAGQRGRDAAELLNTHTCYTDTSTAMLTL